MKKKLIILSTVLCLSSSFTTYAQEKNLTLNSESILTQNSQEKIKDELISLDNKYEDIEIDFNSKSKYSKNSLLKFDTMEEFENFIVEFESLIKENNKININLDENNNKSVRSYNGVTNISKWIPLNIFNLTCNLEMDISYIYDYNNGKKYFVRGTDVSSYESGINIALSWIQTASALNVRNNGKTLEAEVLGYWLNGVEIAGVEIGLKLKQNYLGSLNLK